MEESYEGGQVPEGAVAPYMDGWMTCLVETSGMWERKIYFSSIVACFWISNNTLFNNRQIRVCIVIQAAIFISLYKSQLSITYLLHGAESFLRS